MNASDMWSGTQPLQLSCPPPIRGYRVCHTLSWPHRALLLTSLPGDDCSLIRFLPSSAKGVLISHFADLPKQLESLLNPWVIIPGEGLFACSYTLLHSLLMYLLLSCEMIDWWGGGAVSIAYCTIDHFFFF